jgi:hypothetical protein
MNQRSKRDPDCIRRLSVGFWCGFTGLSCWNGVDVESFDYAILHDTPAEYQRGCAVQDAVGADLVTFGGALLRSQVWKL